MNFFFFLNFFRQLLNSGINRPIISNRSTPFLPRVVLILGDHYVKGEELVPEKFHGRAIEAGRITMDLATLLVMSMYAVLRTPLLVSLLSGTLLSTYYCLVALSYLFCYVSLCNLEIGLPQFHPLSRLLPIYCTESRTITNTL